MKKIHLGNNTLIQGIKTRNYNYMFGVPANKVKKINSKNIPNYIIKKAVRIIKSDLEYYTSERFKEGYGVFSKHKRNKYFVIKRELINSHL